jgi:hypothetical protein
MSTEATQTGADVADLESLFGDADPNGTGTDNGGQESLDGTQQTNGNQDAIEVIDPETGETVLVDAQGNRMEAATGDDANELQLEVDPNGTQNAVLVIPDDHAVVLNVDGKEITKTFAELRADAQKYEGANRKFEEAAALRKEYTDKAANLGQREQQLGQVLDFYIGQSRELMKGQEPNWAELIQNDPQKYLVEKHNWEQRQLQLQQAEQVRQNVARLQAEQNQASAAQRAQQAQTDLVKAIPEWSDPKKLAEGARDIDTYLASVGISPEMRAQIDTAAVVIVARKAMLYDQAVAKLNAKKAANGGKVPVNNQQRQLPAPRQQQGRVERPGAARSAAQTTASQQNLARAHANARFDKNPSVDTLSSFFE